MKIATTAVIQYEGKILIGQRRRDDRWELPGGKIEASETPQECIVREIKEELGIQINILKPLDEIEGTFRNIPMQVHAFLTQYIDGPIVLNVHKDARWITLGEVQDYDMVEEDRLILERLRDGYYQDAP